MATKPNLLARIMGSDEPAGQGHNNPPSDMEILQQRLAENSTKLMTQADQLLTTAACLPDKITSDEQAGIAGDVIKEITGMVKSLESTRVAEKEPYLGLTRAVDGFFKVPMNKLDAAKALATKPLHAWNMEKARLERVAREDEARRLREDADRQAEAAAALEKSNPIAASAGMVEAVVTEQRAQHVASTVNAKPAELASSRGIGGSLAGLRTRIVGKVESRQMLDLNALRPYFTEDSLQKALNAAIAAGVRQVTGATIFEQTDTVVR